MSLPYDRRQNAPTLHSWSVPVDHQRHQNSCFRECDMPILRREANSRSRAVCTSPCHSRTALRIGEKHIFDVMVVVQARIPVAPEAGARPSQVHPQKGHGPGPERRLEEQAIHKHCDCKECLSIVDFGHE